MNPALPQTHIIIGEDNPADSRLISLCLETWEERFDISCFPGGRRLQTYLQTNEPAPIPTIIFLDFFLPEMDGPQLMKWIRQESAWAHTPAVLMSGSYLEEVMKRSYEFGGNYFLEKSTDPEQFFREINGIVGFLLRYTPTLAPQSNQS